ncbi:DUF3231 family protein [Pelosinus fermentans]|uniref:DUF3231 family protein n=1 Tax=Pelosinus fermentans JBW45 TaxID=1192197 RepID=I8U5V9_9FIRM|nr:DUF3231 family protein [Pelosinus fermentans]AJQ27907.1 Protein of unknown function DUF3231 [Pelosinus fermentans JBW45]
MSNISHIRLTSAEIAIMWSQYQSDSLAKCVLKYFLAKVEDEEIRPLLDFALSLSQNHVAWIRSTYQNEEFASPVGFTNEDVNTNAEKLFDDIFTLHYLNNMSRVGLAAYGLALSTASRQDIREFYIQTLHESIELNERVVKLMLEKGIYARSPYIPANKHVEFAKQQAFLGNVFKESRPLTAVEIMHVFMNIQTNIMGKAMITGFWQTASSPDIRSHFLRGKEIAQKHIEIFTKRLEADDLTGGSSMEPLITTVSQSPFSEKLMLFHISALIQMGIGNYGVAISTSQCYDLAIDYTRLMAEIALYAEDGANLMIKYGWLEEPPQAVDRQMLVENQNMEIFS